MKNYQAHAYPTLRNKNSGIDAFEVACKCDEFAFWGSQVFLHLIRDNCPFQKAYYRRDFFWVNEQNLINEKKNR